MKTLLKFVLLASTAMVVFVLDMKSDPSWQPEGFQLVSEAHAVYGRQRRTRRRGAAVGYAAGTASGAAAASAATSSTQEQSAPAQPATAPESGAQPIGTVVSTLPAGCSQVDIGGVEYQKCGPDYYRAAFQGNNLVYVTAQP